VLSTPATVTGFGTTVENTGDLNGDGYGDFIVGAVAAERFGQSATSSSH
jgi:hypothetical protein